MIGGNENVYNNYIAFLSIAANHYLNRREKIQCTTHHLGRYQREEDWTKQTLHIPTTQTHTKILITVHRRK